MNRTNIQYIVNSALCTACGACSGICPSNAIHMKSNPAGYVVAEIDLKSCNSCGVCHKVCPSVAANQTTVEGVDRFRGVCLSAYIGCSTDPEIRQKSQSGGVVTALLDYLLEQGVIEGAIVNRFNAITKRSEVACVKTKEDLLAAAGSYYTQSSVAKAVLENRDKQIAAVVLGCQAESLKLAKDAFPETGAPAYTIGLVLSKPSASGGGPGEVLPIRGELA